MNVYLILIIVFIVLILEGALIIIHSQRNLKPQNKGKNSVAADDISKVVSKVSEEIIKQDKSKWDHFQQQLSKFKIELDEFKSELDKMADDNVSVSAKLTKLTQDFSSLNIRCNELEKLNGKEPALDSQAIIDRADAASHTDMKNDTMSPNGATQGKENMIAKEEDFSQKKKISMQKEMPDMVVSKEIIMYSSLPRSVNGENYFADLTTNKIEDSYFEFKISSDMRHAKFAPLDYMKICTCDDAKIAILTDGAKPNEASQVIKMDFGTAHEEDNYWIIDKPVKIKLV